MTKVNWYLTVPKKRPAVLSCHPYSNVDLVVFVRPFVNGKIRERFGRCSLISR